MTCTRCGRPVAEGALFCSGCGAPVAAGSQATTVVTRRSNRTAWLAGALAAAVVGVAVAFWASRRAPVQDLPAVPPVVTDALGAATAQPATALPAPPTDEPGPAATEPATAAPTEAPTLAPTAPPATLVPPPTVPPAPTATTEPTVSPVSVEFYPENGQFVIPDDQLCTALNWRTTGVTDLFLQREGGERTAVGPSGRQGDICFSDDEMIFFLYYRLPDGREESRSVRLERE